MDRVCHPVRNDGVQDFLFGCAVLAGQQINCVEDGALREIAVLPIVKEIA
jgi:hypothetical protein